MKKSNGVRIVAVALVLLGGLLIGALGTTRNAAAHALTQGDPIAVVQAMAKAFNSGDKAALDALLGPAFEDTTSNPPPGAPPEVVSATRSQFIDESGAAGPHVTPVNCVVTDATTVVCDTTLSGGPLPPLPHPFTEKSTFTVVDGKVTRLVETFSDQTFDDLAALFASGTPEPGMPTTGAGDTPAPLLFLGVLFALALLTAGGVITNLAPARRV